MASEKDKRFRVHVVKELYETERDYTQQLEFTVTYILAKAKEKGEHDNSFTADIIQTLFCNIEAILDFHRSLVTQLEACIGPKGPAYDTQIAGCYLQQKEQFHLYQRYGESNEQAQKLLYELYEKDQFKAFFVACMLLGGRNDEDISGLVFKPIQRVCKYPLLFRELSKYTPEGHCDYDATQGCLAMMRDICSVINEAKRRVEKLEWIADWQATVEGWEGTNVVDTCNELIKEGSLIKISAGNTQERQFYLFDNLLVYCKKNSLLKGKGILFRGRVPVANLDIENIVDGTSDYHTHGIAVSNSWKVHNLAKNKWFVLVAKSAEEKSAWIEAIRREKEKRKRLAAAQAQDNRALALDKGEKIYFTMRRDKFMRDHKLRLRTYPNSFTGCEFVGWLVDKGEVTDNDQAVLLGQALLENGVIHHVADRHQFKNDRDLLYRYRYDDGTFRSKIHCSDVTARGVRAYTTLHALFDPLIKEQKVGLRTMRGVVNSAKIIDWWLADKDIHSRQAGVELGQELFATGFLRHATDEHNFKDGTFLYRFTADDGHDGGRDRKLTSVLSKVEFSLSSTGPCRTITLPSVTASQFALSSNSPLTVTSSSPEAQLQGLCKGQTVLAINGCYSPTSAPGEDRPISLLISRPASSEYAELVQTSAGLGFHIKGNSPVVIHGVDKGSSAAGAGIVPSTCILKVGSTDVVRSSHEAVVSAVKDCLVTSKAKLGEGRVSLKLSFPHLEQLSVYQYESAEGSLLKLHERVTESPYTFTLPSQILKHCAERMKGVVAAVKESGVTSERVTEYVQNMSKLALAYERVGNMLGQPRWPSYKLHSHTHPQTLDVCPTNLHITLLDIVTPPETGNSPSDDTLITCYPITTMAIPSIKAGLVDSKGKSDTLGHIHSREELCEILERYLSDIEGDCEAISRMIDGGAVSSPNQLLPPHTLVDDRTPTNSPLLGRKGRPVSVSNPAALIALVVESLVSKAKALQQWLQDKLLASVLAETDPLLSPSPSSSQLITEFTDSIPTLCEAIVKSPAGEPILKPVAALLQSTARIASALKTRLAISLALVDDVGLREGSDKLFSQLLTGVASGVGHSLLAALRERLNPAAEYNNNDNSLASSQWLQLAASKGILVHLQTTMATGQANELAALRDLQYVLTQLSRVVVHVKESPTHQMCTELPHVSLAGNGPHLYYHLPPSLCQALPEEFHSEHGVKIVPILFNTALEDGPESGMDSSLERSVNGASFKSLKDYYQGLRGLRLNKSNLPSDAQAKLLAIHNISQPLNAMDILVRQVEVAVKEPSRPGAGLLCLTAELCARMGAVRLNMCDTGVFRSCLASSLEQVALLTRCHGLPFKSFRSTLNKIRRKGSFHCIARKNSADISKSIPRLPPKLYQLPPEDSEN